MEKGAQLLSGRVLDSKIERGAQWLSGSVLECLLQKRKEERSGGSVIECLTQRRKEERSGSVVECLTRERLRGCVSSLAGRAALCHWARRFMLCLVLVQPRKAQPDMNKNC